MQRLIEAEYCTPCAVKNSLEIKAALADELAAALKKLTDTWNGTPFSYDYLGKPMREAEAALAKYERKG